MNPKIYTVIIALALVAALATLVFQALEMNDYALFETIFK